MLLAGSISSDGIYMGRKREEMQHVCSLIAIRAGMLYCDADIAVRSAHQEALRDWPYDTPATPHSGEGAKSIELSTREM